MRFTSLVVELIRARPRLVVWLVILVQAALWLVVPLLLYRAPPGALATVVAFGREYQVGTDLGPPLSFWLADIAFRLAGNHMLGVYILAQLCAVATFWILYVLSRAILGGQQAVLAVLLTMTVLAFGADGLEFGPDVLARLIWALLLLHSWQLIGQNRGKAWFAWSIDAGLLLLTTSSAAWLLLLVVVFALATMRGRRMLKSIDPLFALLVIVVLALPYLMWLMRADAIALPALPSLADLGDRAFGSAQIFGGLALACSGILLLVILNSRWIARPSEEAPVIFRPPVQDLARRFVYFFALAPALAGSLLAGLFGREEVVAGSGVVLLMSGLAVMVAADDLVPLHRQRLLRSVWAAAIVAPAVAIAVMIVVWPWIGGSEMAITLPASAMGRFFDDNFERRTNHPMPAVAGDPQLASLVALDTSRPHLYLDATPQRSPWFDAAKFREKGGVVVWRAADTAGTPPADIAQRFPGLVPEVPRIFDWPVAGRQSVLRIGWAIVRPANP